MIGGPKYRGSHATTTSLVTSNTSAVLECAESGSLHAFRVDPAASPRRASVTNGRRKVSTKTTLGRYCLLRRARLRQMIIFLDRYPQQRFVVVLGALIFFVLLLGVSMILVEDSESPSSGLAIDRDFMLSHQPLRAYKPKMAKAKVDRANWYSNRRGSQLSFEKAPTLKLLIESIQPSFDMFFFPSNWDTGRASPDYAGLDFDFFEEDSAERNIVRDSELFETPVHRDSDASLDDDMTDAYYYDDDYLRGLETAYGADREKDEHKRCRKVSEHELSFPNCNDFHQLDRLDPLTGLRYLNAGGYREVFSLVHTFVGQSDLVVMKDILFANDFDYKQYEFVRMDAIVAERLSSSPRTYNIYGFCGLGIISEFFYHGDMDGPFLGGDDGAMKAEELQDEAELMPQNHLTGTEKLVLALEMAEAVAVLHGYEGGLIIHDDIQLSQFLFNQNKTGLVLNDFNRAEFPLFDEKAGDYCRYRNGEGGGNWRAPEEYRDEPLLEEIDVWSMVRLALVPLS